MANLYDLTAKYKHLQLALECNPDDKELEALFAEIDDNIEAKAEGYAMVMRNMESDIDGLDKEIKRLTERKTVMANGIKRMKNNLYESMKATGKTKFKTELFSFGIQKNGGAEPLVVDVTVDELPSELVKVTKEVDKDALRKYIKETGDFSFGHFTDRGESLRIR